MQRFLLKKKGFRFEAHALSLDECLMGLYLAEPGHEAFSDCDENHLTGFEVNVVYTGAEVKDQILALASSLRSEGVCCVAEDFDKSCGGIFDEYRYPITVIEPIRECAQELAKGADAQTMHKAMRQYVYALSEAVMRYEGGV